MNQEKMKGSQQYEISLTELAAAVYLFFMRKWLFIIILTVAGLVIGFLSRLKELPAQYKVNIKISSGIVKSKLIKNALSNIWCEPCDETGIEKGDVFSKEISDEIIYVKKMGGPLMVDEADTSALNIVLSIEDSAKTQIAVNDIINHILNEDTIKSILSSYRIFRKNYMAKLNEKIAEIEAFQKIFQPDNIDIKFNAEVVEGWFASNEDYLDLLNKRFYMRIWDDSKNPITVEIISVTKTVTNSLARRLVLYGFSFFMIAVFLGFAYDFHRKVLSHIRENAIKK